MEEYFPSAAQEEQADLSDNMISFLDEEISIHALPPGVTPGETKHDRPLYVLQNGTIYMETYNPFFKLASVFVSAIADPVSRTECIHEYKVGTYSLFGAASAKIPIDVIVSGLMKLSKTPPSERLIAFIKGVLMSFGRVELVSTHEGVFLEARDDRDIQSLLRNEDIRASVIWTTTTASNNSRRGSKRPRVENEYFYERYEEDDTPEKVRDVARLRIRPDQVVNIKETALNIGYSIIESIELRGTDRTYHLKDNARLRPYQKEALRAQFSGSLARSGMIVLPCGAGKTITGIASMCTIGLSTLLVVPNHMSGRQWKSSLVEFTTLQEDQIKTVSDDPLNFDIDANRANIVIITYTSMGMDDDKRSPKMRIAMQRIRKTCWGLLILDEVHMAPAKKFGEAVQKLVCKCKLGLTATLVREDDQINRLNFLIGPKLYEADWMELTRDGYLSKVICMEVHCPMSVVFEDAYLMEPVMTRRYVLAILNPNKFAACKRLKDHHESQGDKILIFLDSVAAVTYYSVALHCYCMHATTSEAERSDLIARFKMENHRPKAINTLILSRVGDVAIDLPMANVIIQVSAHYGSRRQEAQRLGRLLRLKPSWMPRRHSMFYSLLSVHTEEMGSNGDRQRYLINQGYTYSVITWAKLFGEPDGYMDDQVSLEVQEHMLTIVPSTFKKEDKQLKASDTVDEV